MESLVKKSIMSQIDKVKVIPRRLLKDERGWFLKAITGTEENIPNHTGEVYLTMGKPGQAKGGHYHPEAVEWFTIVQGSAILKLEDMETHERRDIPMSLAKAITVLLMTPMRISSFWLIQISCIIRKTQYLIQLSKQW